MSLEEAVTVFGAYGHTGRFVISELSKRGWRAVLSGRDVERLKGLGKLYPSFGIRPASVEDPSSLDVAISGSSAVINCAGPFLDTNVPLIEAAIRSGVHYLDIAAEQLAVVNAFERFESDERARRIVIAPAVGFYGGLGDLLATAAMGDWKSADEICIAVALDSWQPTRGTRLTGQRNPGQRFIFSKNKLERADPPPGRKWNFSPPFGELDVIPLSLSESITISHHLQVPEIGMFMNLAPLSDLRNPDTPTPSAADDSGRSAQTFVMDVIAKKDGKQRRVVARGRDIYAITAPIVVEATQRAVTGPVKATGIVALGETFDAHKFLNALSPAHLSIEVVTPG